MPIATSFLVALKKKHARVFVAKEQKLTKFDFWPPFGQNREKP